MKVPRRKSGAEKGIRNIFQETVVGKLNRLAREKSHEKMTFELRIQGCMRASCVTTWTKGNRAVQRPWGEDLPGVFQEQQGSQCDWSREMEGEHSSG